MIGHDGTESTRSVWLILDRRLQPARPRDPYHEPRLIVLVNGIKSHLRRQDEIAVGPSGEQMPVVRFEAVVGLLPEIGPTARFDPEASVDGI